MTVAMGFNFRVFLPLPPDLIPGVQPGFSLNTVVGFQSVSGLDAEIEVEDYREGGANRAAHRFARFGAFRSVVFRRGLARSMAIWHWHDAVLGGLARPPRTDVLVVLLDHSHRNTAGWLIRSALPERLLGPDLQAQASAIAIETLELSHEGIHRLSPQSLPALGGPGPA